MQNQLTSDQAIANGYIDRILIDHGGTSIEALIRPDADLDSRFDCFDVDECEYLNINGWMVASIERLDG